MATSGLNLQYTMKGYGIQSGKLITIAILFLLSAAGCTNRQNTKIESNSLSISFDFPKNPVAIQDIGLIDDDVRILNLDCKEAIFGEISKIVKYKDRIYLMDNALTNSVIIYDTTGRFVSLISQRGQGPKEYLQLTDIFVDSINATLNIVSRIDKKLMQYDLNGENLLDIKKLPKAFTQFSKTEFGYVGYMGNYSENRSKRYNLWTMDSDLDLENSYFDIDPLWESHELGGGSVFSFYKGKLFYITPLDYNIYAVGEDNISVPYTFNLGNAEWPSEYKRYEEREWRRIGDNHINRFINFQETSNHLIVKVLYNGQYLLGVYNKVKKESYIADLQSYIGNIILSFGLIAGMDENYIYTLVDASIVKKFRVGKDKYNDFEAVFPEQIKRLREKFNDVNEDGNPFLILYPIN